MKQVEVSCSKSGPVWIAVTVLNKIPDPQLKVSTQVLS